MKKPESKLQRDTRRALEIEVGGFWFKVHGGMFQRAGIPDLLGCVEGLYIGVELKIGKKGRISGVQKTVKKLIKDNGGLSIIATTPELAVRRVKKWLKKHGKTPTTQTVFLSKESGKIRGGRGERRLIHGAGNWEDDYRTRDRSKKTPKKISKSSSNHRA